MEGLDDNVNNNQKLHQMATVHTSGYITWLKRNIFYKKTRKQCRRREL